MKKVKRILCGLLAVCVLSGLLCTSASASTDSSAYLDGYSAFVSSDSGKVYVTVDVAGVNFMDKIGTTLIILYESKDNKTFDRVATFKSEHYPAMMLTNESVYYKTPVSYKGTVGYYYKASVYVYAEKDGGSDEKHYLTSSKICMP